MGFSWNFALKPQIFSELFWNQNYYQLLFLRMRRWLSRNSSRIKRSEITGNTDSPSISKVDIFTDESTWPDHATVDDVTMVIIFKTIVDQTDPFAALSEITWEADSGIQYYR